MEVCRFKINFTFQARFTHFLLGNVFPGASVPNGLSEKKYNDIDLNIDYYTGMAKAVADTNSGSNQGGFTTDGSQITGFSVSIVEAVL